jgi:hypothetical protein
VHTRDEGLAHQRELSTVQPNIESSQMEGTRPNFKVKLKLNGDTVVLEQASDNSGAKAPTKRASPDEQDLNPAKKIKPESGDNQNSNDNLNGINDNDNNNNNNNNDNDNKNNNAQSTPNPESQLTPQELLILKKKSEKAQKRRDQKAKQQVSNASFCDNSLCR